MRFFTLSEYVEGSFELLAASFKAYIRTSSLFVNSTVRTFLFTLTYYLIFNVAIDNNTHNTVTIQKRVTILASWYPIFW